MSKPLLSATLAVVSCCQAWAATDSRPNFVLFIGDDIGWNDVGCYGNPQARTPNVDALASHGLRFTNAYLTASSCSPSRLSIITGRYPHNLGHGAELHRPMASHLPMFPALLKEHGYYTALAGKEHMPQEAAPGKITGIQQAFVKIADHSGNVEGNSGGHARWVEFVKNRPQDRPFFFWFAAHDAHRQWDGDRQWDATRYGKKHSPEEVRLPPFLVDTPGTRQDLASYYNEVTRFDYYIGQVVDELRAEGVLDNTLLLVMADNGRPFPRAKTRVHDSGMKTPLVVHWPEGLKFSGSECASLVSAIDIAPTILKLAGVPVPETVQGIDVSGLLINPQDHIRSVAFSEHNWHDYEAYGRSARSDGFLYILNGRPDLPWQGPADSVRSVSHQDLLNARDAHLLTAAQADVLLAPRPREELYYTRSDPNQLHNLVEDPAYRDTLNKLRGLLSQWRAETGDDLPEDLSRDRYDRETGKPVVDSREQIYGTTPGERSGAEHRNAPGPH